MADNAAETGAIEASSPVPRNWKKLLIIGGGAALIVLVLGLLLVLLLSGGDKPAKKPKAKKPVTASEQKAASAAVTSLEAEKQKLLEEQIALLRKENAALKQPQPAPNLEKGGVMSSEKNCELSGDPAKRKEELRACLGVPSTEERQQGMALEANSTKPAEPREVHWGYWGEGAPEHWGGISKDFAKCETGRQQSPINIVGSLDKGAPKLDFDYRPSALKLVNNGHSLQVNYTPGSFLKIDGQPYDLVQFHFHTPSEEQIRGRMADMDIHFVHKNKAGQLAVVAVLLNVGVEHPALKPIWSWFPAAPGPEQVINEISINAANILPVDRQHYYAFDGSLTTPPCTEGVRWFVLKQAVSISREQLKRFMSFYPFNARPAQPLNGRKIREN